jgi:hypothetical protein
MGAAPAEATIVEVVERQDGSVASLGLALAEGRALLAKVQSILVSQADRGLDGEPGDLSPPRLVVGA